MKFNTLLLPIICIFINFISAFKSRKSRKINDNSESDLFKLSFMESTSEVSLSLENKIPNITAKNHSWLNNTRETISEMVYRIINSNSRKGLSKGIFINNQRGKMDFNMNDGELKELFSYMLFRQEKVINENSLNIFSTLYVRDWVLCDADSSGTMTFKEFMTCMKNSTYLNFLVLPPNEFASRPVYNNTEVYYNTIFRLLDEKNWGYLNFLQFMYLRLYAFSWRYCSVFAPYIDENSFECALEVVANYKALSRSKLKNLYRFGLELSYTENYKNMDFISFMQIAEPVRLFAKINSKQDEDLTRSEFERALDNGILPARFNQDIVNMFFFLTDEKDRYGENIDLMSFVFYDFFLKIFHVYSIDRPMYLNRTEFINVIDYPDDLFPTRMRDEIGLIPQYNLTHQSYKMYMFTNILYSEKDHLYKAFLETSANTELKEKNSNTLKSNLKKFSSRSLSNNQYDINARPINYPIRSYFRNKTTTEHFYNITFSMNLTCNKIFEMLDLDNDEFINFYDFANFMQMAWVFSSEDKYLRGRIAAEYLRETLTQWSNFPAISFRTRDKAYRFTQLAPEAPVDLLSLVEIMKIDDAVKMMTKRDNEAVLGELEMKRVLQQMNMEFIPDTMLNQCLRGLDSRFVPRYDWECAFIEGLKANLKYFEANDYYQLSKFKKISLKATSFFNIDPNYV